jgi:hypothetical protein
MVFKPAFAKIQNIQQNTVDTFFDPSTPLTTASSDLYVLYHTCSNTIRKMQLQGVNTVFWCASVSRLVVATVRMIEIYSVSGQTLTLEASLDISATGLTRPIYGGAVQVRDNQILVYLGHDYTVSTSGSTKNKYSVVLAYSYEISSSAITLIDTKSSSKSYSTTSGGTGTTSFGTLFSTDGNGNVIVNGTSFLLSIRVSETGIISLPSQCAAYTNATSGWYCDAVFANEMYDDAGTLRPVFYAVDGIKSTTIYCRKFYINALSVPALLGTVSINKSTALQEIALVRSVGVNSNLESPYSYTRSDGSIVVTDRTHLLAYDTVDDIGFVLTYTEIASDFSSVNSGLMETPSRSLLFNDTVQPIGFEFFKFLVPLGSGKFLQGLHSGAFGDFTYGDLGVSNIPETNINTNNFAAGAIYNENSFGTSPSLASAEASLFMNQHLPSNSNTSYVPAAATGQLGFREDLVQLGTNSTQFFYNLRGMYRILDISASLQ